MTLSIDAQLNSPLDRAWAQRLSRRRLLQGSLASGAAVLAAPVARKGNLVSAQAGSSTPSSTEDLDAAFAEFDAFIEEGMSKLAIPGVAAGVIVGDQEHTAVFGVTNLDHPLPVATDTLFQIGSTTKTFTGTTVMRLVEQGKLDLDAPVQTYLPDFRVADFDVSAKVQMIHLLTHTAGWYDSGLDVDTGDGDDALALYLESMVELPQITPPGKYFSYNNGAVSLAGRVIESVTGKTYEAAVKELVLDPLGMTQAAFFAEQIMTEGFAVGHGAPPDDPTGAPVVLTPWALPRAADPAGGLISSLDDQLRYARFHLGDGTVNGDRVLTEDSLAQMRTAHGPGGTVPQLVIDNVGVNWMLRNRDGATVVSHAGGTNGQQSDFCLVPERGFAVTTLTNAVAGAALAIEATDWALNRFLGLASPANTPVPHTADQLAEFAGTYALPETGQSIQVTAENDALQLELFMQGQTDPVLASPVQFIGDDLATVDYMGFPIFTDFVRGDDGRVSWIRYFGRMTPRAA